MTSKQRHPFIFRTLRGAAIAVATVTLSCIVACSPRSAFSPLLNSGVMPVSEDNPFMGANLFLAHQMEQSVYLYNFMKDKGAPQGLELKGDSEDDVEAHLYYTSGPEEYIAKPAPQKKSFARNKDNRREWIIIGPFAIDREHYKTVEQLEKLQAELLRYLDAANSLVNHLQGDRTKHYDPFSYQPRFQTKAAVKHKKPSGEGHGVTAEVSNPKGPLKLRSTSAQGVPGDGATG